MFVAFPVPIFQAQNFRVYNSKYRTDITTAHTLQVSKKTRGYYINVFTRRINTIMSQFVIFEKKKHT